MMQKYWLIELATIDFHASSLISHLIVVNVLRRYLRAYIDLRGSKKKKKNQNQILVEESWQQKAKLQGR